MSLAVTRAKTEVMNRKSQVDYRFQERLHSTTSYTRPRQQRGTGVAGGWQIVFLDIPNNVDYYSYKKLHNGDGV
jgi:hypothetical protein